MTAPSANIRASTSGYIKREKITPRIAAQRSKLTVWAIYRLYHRGFIEGERPTENNILIYADSLENHLQATRDPEFWEAH
jgi:hypothetical protein